MLFRKPKEGYDNQILLNLCKDALTPEAIVQKLPEAIQNNFNAEVVEINYNMMFRNELPNSHSCPLKGHTNFTRNSDMLLGYPGFGGHITFTIVPDPHVAFFSGMMGNRNGMSGASILGFNLGSGGGGGDIEMCKDDEIVIVNRLSYDFKIFIDDFPSVKNNISNIIKQKEDALDREERLFKLKYPRRNYQRPEMRIKYNGEYKNKRFRYL